MNFLRTLRVALGPGKFRGLRTAPWGQNFLALFLALVVIPIALMLVAAIHVWTW